MAIVPPVTAQLKQVPVNFRQKLQVWAGWALVALILTLIYYAPAFLEAQHNPQVFNIWAIVTNQPVDLNANAPFYANWNTAASQIRQGQLPLWVTEAHGVFMSGRPLLASSHEPILYPGSLLYYFASGNWKALAFSGFHFWLLAWGGLLIFSKLRRSISSSKRRWWLTGFSVVLVAGTLLAGSLRPDYLAAISLSIIALRLLLAGRKPFQLLWLTPLLGLIWLATGLKVGVLVVAGVLIAALALEMVAGGGRLISRVLKLSGALLIVLVGAVSVAGPQLWPRLAYDFQIERVATATIAPDRQPLIWPLKVVIETVADTRSLPLGNIFPYDELPIVGKLDANLLKRLNSDQRTGQVVAGSAPTEAKVNLLPDGKPFFVLMPVNFADGWNAHLFAGAGDKKGKQVQVYEGNERYCAVLIDPTTLANEGETLSDQLTLRLDYKPLSFELGLYGAFLAVISVGLGMVVLAWLRFYGERDDEQAVRRVAKNSVTPLLAQLVGKVIDVGFAIFTLRLLGVSGTGDYNIAQTTWLYLATVTEFGLETLTTRDVARNRNQANANHYLSTVFVTRSLLSVLALPLALIAVGGLSLSGRLADSSAWAIVILAVGLIPGGFAGCLSAIFRAYEKFEYTAAIQIFTAIVRVPLGLALILMWGVVGLAGSALVVNLVSLWVLYSIFRRKLFVPRLMKFDWKLARTMLRESYPLMLNGFLINVFFQSDVYLLLPFKGDNEVGWYAAAYKFINGLLIIPSTLTLALFPLFSSYSASAKENLIRAYREALRILVAIALPISVGTLFVAYDVIGAVSGSEFLPNTAIALQILIWFLPFSYINGVTQYVLIALNKQRTITLAVIGSVVANVGLNLIFIPAFGYRATSVMTIVSEVVLLIPFGFIIQRALGTMPIWAVSWRPALAALIMGLALATLTLVLHLQNFGLTVVVGGAVYIVALLLVRGFTKDDLRLLKKALKK